MASTGALLLRSRLVGATAAPGARRWAPWLAAATPRQPALSRAGLLRAFATDSSGDSSDGNGKNGDNDNPQDSHQGHGRRRSHRRSQQRQRANAEAADVEIVENSVARVDGDRAPTYPHVLALPAHRRPFFPGVVLPVTVTNPEVTKALLALKESGQQYVGVFLKKPTGGPASAVQDPARQQGHEDLIRDLSEIHHVGSYARIDNLLPFDANSVQVLMVSQRRIVIDGVHDNGPPLRVSINPLENPDFDPKSKLIRAYSNEIVATLREIVKMNPLFKEHIQYFSQRIDVTNPYKLADFAASVTTADGEELQQVMEEMNCEMRLKKALELITKELELSKVQQVIKEQVEEKVTKNQRQYLLMEQLKAIKKELGMEKDDKDAMITKYRERLAAFEAGSIPANVLEVVEEELNKMSMLEKNSSEFNIDKLGRGYQGDPASALLELLDPGQHNAFLDHYMDVPVDLSRVLFICTANVTDTIPGPLLDRMEVIRLSGYDAPEKLQIAKEYLVPKIIDRTGLGKDAKMKTPEALGLTDDAILTLVKQYCRESGRIFRKVALEVVQDIEKAEATSASESSDTSASKPAEETPSVDPERFVITPEKLKNYVGKPVFQSDRMYDKLVPGVVMGLAWTAMGGSSLYIETTPIVSKGEKSGLLTTGQMGSVMEESTKIAYTYARHKLQAIDPENNTKIAYTYARHKLQAIDPENKFFEEAEIHMHVPEGATPKDGPSAGCTMVTALLSLAMNKTVRPNLAMTGELSLVGKVLPVGGIKEKTIAAKRAGVTTLVLPLGNQRDFDELDEYLREGIDVHFADYYEDVFRVAFE
ncbi:hypothetical protein P43SY_003472 [Pythium insidiosum]|uniref:Lon protease homolog n=1 Tax=Pythium insidiosum TaxID=114742 RepID=A0AAD5MEG8_PYTIN|nr:hypothetical protein P43SY_003472 [Pythium insidiosum]